MLDQIIKGRTISPPRLFIYGTEGIGKSTLASNAPKPIFIQTEDGLDQIECDRFPMAKMLQDVQWQIDALAVQEHEYQTVVIDTVDWLELLIWQTICDQFGARSIDKVDGGYGRGHSYALAEWRDLLSRLEELRATRNMAIILLGHAKVETFTDPETLTVQRFSPKLHKTANALLCEWSDAVLFATRDGSAARREGDRILRTVGAYNYVAKNRYSMPDVLPLDFEYIANEIM